MKILLILSDGMRPDAVKDHPVVRDMMARGTCCMASQTVMPSVTLPCHMSLFHSVDPSRHGTTTNVYAPQVRPVSGLIDQLAAAGRSCAMFYNWEELRDLSRPDHLWRSFMVSGHKYGYESATRQCVDEAIPTLKGSDIDFAFLYLGWPDDEGHNHGWMSPEYLHAAHECCDMVGRVIAELGEEYTIIYTADHGGHDRTHGTEMAEDMTIPILFLGQPFPAGKVLEGLSIKDIAPTVATLLGAEIPAEWEGKAVTF